MVRKNSSAIIILLMLLIGTIVLIAYATSSQQTLPTVTLPFFGSALTEEYEQPQVLYSTTLTINKGSVYEVGYDVSSIYVYQRSSQLIEKLNLTGDIQVNDVIAASLWVWWLDGADDYVKALNTWTVGGVGYKQTTLFSVYVDDLQELEGEWNGPMFSGIQHSGGTWIETDPSHRLRVGIHNKDYRFTLQVGENSEHVIASTIDVISENVTNYWAYLDGTSASGSRDLTGTADAGIFANTATKGPDIAAPYNLASSCYMKGKVYWILEYVGVVLSQNEIENIFNTHIVPGNNLKYIIDATFYNGTHFIDPVNGYLWEPKNGALRIPAETPFLWHIRQLKNDNKLHLMFMPYSAKFRIKYNNLVYEWTISGEKNAAGLVENYTIDIANVFGQTVLPNATIELIYPSEKVRFYIPSGFQVRIVSSEWTETHEVPLNSNYVDFGLPSDGTYTVEILGYEKEADVSIERTSSGLRIIVTDERGFALSGAKIVVSDDSGVIVEGVTSDLGIFELSNEQIQGKDQLRIQVAVLKSGTFYKVDELVSIEEIVEHVETAINEAQELVTVYQDQYTMQAIFVLLFTMLIIVVLLFGRKRR